MNSPLTGTKQLQPEQDAAKLYHLPGSKQQSAFTNRHSAEARNPLFIIH